MASATDAAGAAEKLVNDALCSRKAELGLSFYDFPHLGWAIRSHLIGLVSEFPTFLPSAGAFTKPDGKVNVLVNAKGRLPVAPPILTPPLYLTLWLPRGYPLAPPMAFVSSPVPEATLAHPHLDPTTGEATAAPYLTSWEFPLSNLAELARSLASAFESYPPFPALCSPRGRIVYEPEEYEPEQLALALVPEQQQVSWEDALEELASRVHQDLQRFAAEALEAQDLAARMQQRWIRVERTLFDLRRERKELKAVGQGLSEHADMLSNWVRANDTRMFPAETPEDAFEPADAEASAETWSSWDALELVGSCRAIDDLLVAFDKALEERVVSVQEYLKQVRSHAREQFFLTAKVRKVARSRVGNPENRSNTVESFRGMQQRKPKLGT